MDAGGVWADGSKLRFGNTNDASAGNLTNGPDMLRASVGVGLSWISPMGPLRLSYGKPVRKFRTDRIEKFQFQIGTAF